MAELQMEYMSFGSQPYALALRPSFPYLYLRCLFSSLSFSWCLSVFILSGFTSVPLFSDYLAFPPPLPPWWCKVLLLKARKQQSWPPTSPPSYPAALRPTVVDGGNETRRGKISCLCAQKPRSILRGWEEGVERGIFLTACSPAYK